MDMTKTFTYIGLDCDDKPAKLETWVSIGEATGVVIATETPFNGCDSVQLTADVFRKLLADGPQLLAILDAHA